MHYFSDCSGRKLWQPIRLQKELKDYKLKGNSLLTLQDTDVCKAVVKTKQNSSLYVYKARSLQQRYHFHRNIQVWVRQSDSKIKEFKKFIDFADNKSLFCSYMYCV